jgi:hypothetical protein
LTPYFKKTFLERLSIATHRIVHHPVNFSKTSAPPGVQGSTLATADLFLGSNSLDDGRLAMSKHILFDIGSGISKAITNQFLQSPSPSLSSLTLQHTENDR